MSAAPSTARDRDRETVSTDRDVAQQALSDHLRQGHHDLMKGTIAHRASRVITLTARAQSVNPAADSGVRELRELIASMAVPTQPYRRHSLDAQPRGVWEWLTDEEMMLHIRH